MRHLLEQRKRPHRCCMHACYFCTLSRLRYTLAADRKIKLTISTALLRLHATYRQVSTRVSIVLDIIFHTVTSTFFDDVICSTCDILLYKCNHPTLLRPSRTPKTANHHNQQTRACFCVGTATPLERPCAALMRIRHVPCSSIVHAMFYYMFIRPKITLACEPPL